MLRLGDVVTVVLRDGKGARTERHALVQAVWGTSNREMISALSVEEVGAVMWRGEKIQLGRYCSWHQIPHERFSTEKDRVIWTEKPSPLRRAGEQLEGVIPS